MTTIDIPTIAQTLARTYPTIPAGTTTKSGGRATAETIERLLDDAARLGAFTDLADRASIEVSTLTHTDRAVWILLEFDRDHRLLRTGPVPVEELTGGDTQGVASIAALLGRIRRLMGAAVLLSTPPASTAALAAQAHWRRNRVTRLSIAGAALDEMLLDAVRSTCLDFHDEPGGGAARLGAALAAVRDHAPSKAQAYGPDPMPAHIEALWQEASEAEDAVAADHLPASLNVSLQGAGYLVAGLIDAFTATRTEQPTAVESPVVVGCRKRREACAELVASSFQAQQFVFEQTGRLSATDSMATRAWIGALHTDVIRGVETALLLSDIAEAAEHRDERRAGRDADIEARRFFHKAELAVANAWFAAAECLRLVEPDARRAVVEDWERRTGCVFAGDWDGDR